MKNAKASMTSSHPSPAPRSPAADPQPETQYLKFQYFSQRRRRLAALAAALGCTWQSIAYAAIDELLDREAPPEKFS